MKKETGPLAALRHHVTGAIERGEVVAIVGHSAEVTRRNFNKRGIKITQKAAHELLEALRNLVKSSVVPNLKNLPAARDLARAAIAEAEGKA